MPCLCCDSSGVPSKLRLYKPGTTNNTAKWARLQHVLPSPGGCMMCFTHHAMHTMQCNLLTTAAADHVTTICHNQPAKHDGFTSAQHNVTDGPDKSMTWSNNMGKETGGETNRQTHKHTDGPTRSLAGDKFYPRKKLGATPSVHRLAAMCVMQQLQHKHNTTLYYFSSCNREKEQTATDLQSSLWQGPSWGYPWQPCQPLRMPSCPGGCTWRLSGGGAGPPPPGSGAWGCASWAALPGTHPLASLPARLFCVFVLFCVKILTNAHLEELMLI